MRKFDADLYVVAKEALKTFVATFKTETLPIVFAWAERELEASTNISWQNPDDYEYEGLYGTSAGLYIAAEVGEYFIYLPETTKTFVAFIDAMANMHINDDIPNEIMMSFDGESTVKFKFVSYVEDVTDSIKMTTAKTLAKDLVNMICESSKVEFYEGDDEPKEHVYHPGDKEPANYFVGFKGEYNIYEVG